MAAFMSIDQPRFEPFDFTGGSQDSAMPQVVDCKDVEMDGRGGCERDRCCRDSSAAARKSPSKGSGVLSGEKRKTAGPTPAVCNQNLTCLFAVDRFFEFSSRGNLRDAAGGDLNRGTRLRVAPIAGFSLGNGERPKTNQSYPVSLFEGSSDAVHGGVDRSCRLCLAHVAGARDTVHEISFVHLLS